MLPTSLWKLSPAVQAGDRRPGGLPLQTPQWRQNPGTHTVRAVNLALLFVARPIRMGPSRVLQLRWGRFPGVADQNVIRLVLDDLDDSGDPGISASGRDLDGAPDQTIGELAGVALIA